MNFLRLDVLTGILHLQIQIQELLNQHLQECLRVFGEDGPMFEKDDRATNLYVRYFR